MVSKETTGGGKDDAPKAPAKPAMKPGMFQKPEPLHPRALFGKGGKHPTQPTKGRSFRHQGR